MFVEVESHLQACIERGVFPGAQYVIGERGVIVVSGALGAAVLEPERIPATTETIYDLASLTKPLVTTLLTMMFAERSLLRLDAPVGDYLQECRDTDKRDITLLELLTHTSGLEDWRPLYLDARRRQDAVAAIARSSRAQQPAIVVYSDLNFILLGFLLERLAGERLDRLAERNIFAPLGLRRTMFNPPAALQRQIAATERGQDYERATVARRQFVCPLPATEAIEAEAKQNDTGKGSPQPLRRKQTIWGAVHDGNAYFLDGVAGHAGLFSTAAEVFHLASQFLPGSRLLQAETLAVFSRNFTEGRGAARSPGWMLAATEDCSAGAALDAAAFGHTGFTGVSVWVEAKTERVFVLLTNRVHPLAVDGGVKAARQSFHRLAASA